MEWIKLDERKPDIYYYSEDTVFDRYIRDTVTNRRYIYRVFNGAARVLTRWQMSDFDRIYVYAEKCSPY